MRRRRKKKRRKWKGEGTREKEARVDSGVMYVGMTSESVGARPPCEYIEAFGRHYGAIRAVCRGETLIYTERQRQLSLPLPPPGGSRIIPFTEIIPRTVGEIFATFLYRRKGDAYTLLIAFLYTKMKSFYPFRACTKNIGRINRRAISISRHDGRNKLGIEQQERGKGRSWGRGEFRASSILTKRGHYLF